MMHSDHTLKAIPTESSILGQTSPVFSENDLHAFISLLSESRIKAANKYFRQNTKAIISQMITLPVINFITPSIEIDLKTSIVGILTLIFNNYIPEENHSLIEKLIFKMIQEFHKNGINLYEILDILPNTGLACVRPLRDLNIARFETCKSNFINLIAILKSQNGVPEKTSIKEYLIPSETTQSLITTTPPMTLEEKTVLQLLHELLLTLVITNDLKLLESIENIYLDQEDILQRAIPKLSLYSSKEDLNKLQLLLCIVCSHYRFRDRKLSCLGAIINLTLKALDYPELEKLDTYFHQYEFSFDLMVHYKKMTGTNTVAYTINSIMMELRQLIRNRKSEAALETSTANTSVNEVSTISEPISLSIFYSKLLNSKISDDAVSYFKNHQIKLYYRRNEFPLFASKSLLTPEIRYENLHSIEQLALAILFKPIDRNKKLTDCLITIFSWIENEEDLNLLKDKLMSYTTENNATSYCRFLSRNKPNAMQIKSIQNKLIHVIKSARISQAKSTNESNSKTPKDHRSDKSVKRKMTQAQKQFTEQTNSDIDAVAHTSDDSLGSTATICCSLMPNLLLLPFFDVAELTSLPDPEPAVGQEAPETNTGFTAREQFSNDYSLHYNFFPQPQATNIPSNPSISHSELTLLDCGLTDAPATNLYSDIATAVAEISVPAQPLRRLTPKQMSQHPHWATQFSPQAPRPSLSSAVSLTDEFQGELRNA